MKIANLILTKEDSKKSLTLPTHRGKTKTTKTTKNPKKKPKPQKKHSKNPKKQPQNQKNNKKKAVKNVEGGHVVDAEVL